MTGQRYTLFGFSKELDWRPLHFVEPIPAHRICNACGLVPRVTVFLPCRHLLCQTCYEQCLSDDVHSCPLDGEPFHEEDAQWGEFRFDFLLKRKVRCWNEDNGCKVVMAASDLHKHFYEDCAHHSTRCPKCSAFVLTSNICAHRRTDCSNHAAHNMAAASTTHGGSSQEAMFKTLETILEKRVAELRSGLQEVVRDITQCDKLTELSHSVNALRDTVMKSSEEQMSATSEAGIATVREIKEDIAWQGSRLNEISLRLDTLGEKMAEAVQDTTKKSSERFQDKNGQAKRDPIAYGEVLQNVSQSEGDSNGTIVRARERATKTVCQELTSTAGPRVAPKPNQAQSGAMTAMVTNDHLAWFSTLNVKHFEFHVKGFKKLKDNAVSKGTSCYYRGTTYLGGYCLSPGVYLKKSGNSASVHALVRLNRGVIDRFLPWPFNYALKFTFIDTSKGTRHEFFNIIVGSRNGKRYERPIEERNDGVSSGAGFHIENFERQGYLGGDEFCVKCELLPPNAE